MDPMTEAMLCVAMAMIGSILAWKFGFLTISGAVAAFATAALIGACGGLFWLITYLLFPAVSFLATWGFFEEKEEEGLQEGEKGERSASNILAVGMFPAIIALLTMFTEGAEFELSVAFIAAVAVALSDTVASEVGVGDRYGTWMITTLKPCEPGINGGVSILGTFTSLMASIAFSVVAWAMIFVEFDLLFLLPAFCGMFGNILDSVLGEILENKHRITNYTNNASTQLAGAALAFFLASLI